MTSYFQISRRAAWAMLIVTLLLALLIFFAVGFVSAVLALLQHFMVPGEHPWRFSRMLSLVAAIVLCALVLARFYLIVALRLPSARYALTGWLVSAAFHAALTCFFIMLMPGTVQVSGNPLRLPLSVLSGAASFGSLYLFIRYPRPPKLPVIEAA